MLFNSIDDPEPDPEDDFYLPFDDGEVDQEMLDENDRVGNLPARSSSVPKQQTTEVFRITGRILKDTGKAMLIRFILNGVQRNEWFPAAQIKKIANTDCTEMTIDVTAWIAKQKGLIP